MYNLKSALAEKGYNLHRKAKQFGDEITCLKTRIMVYAKKVRNLVNTISKILSDEKYISYFNIGQMTKLQNLILLNFFV
jgi:hypothetical protein